MESSGSPSPPRILVGAAGLGDNSEPNLLPSHPADQDITDVEMKTEKSEDALVIASLKQQFHEQWDGQADPKMVFGVIKNWKGIKEDDFWLCFCLAYPRAASSVVALRNGLQKLSSVLVGHYGDQVVLHQCSASDLRWRGRLDSLQEPQPGRPYNWRRSDVRICESIALIATSWEALSPVLSTVTEPVERFDGMSERLDVLVRYLRERADLLQSYQSKIEEYARAKEQNARLLSPSTGDVHVGISKRSSWTSSSLVPLSPLNMRGRSTKKGLDAGAKPESFSEIFTHPPFRRRVKGRLRRHWRRIATGMRKQWESVLDGMGRRGVVLSTVIFLAVLGAVTTAISTWECSPTTIPTVDSNFWSTISSAAIGLASLYCTIIPLLRKQEVKVDDPRLFHWLLFTSMITALISMICYPFQTIASSVLLYVSSVAQLATTLQIIEGAVSKIVEDHEFIEEQNEEIMYLENELERLPRQ